MSKKIMLEKSYCAVIYDYKNDLERSHEGPTNCLSLTEEISVLGVLTRASSHPVGSKSFV